MSEMREYQQKMLESKGKGIVLCDWDRGKGKTYSIANFIAKNINFNRPLKILIVGNYDCREIAILLRRKLERKISINGFDIVYHGVKGITVSSFNDSKKYILADIVTTLNIEKTRGMEIDYALCDEYIPSSNELNMFYNSGAKKVYILGTFGIDYISDKEVNEEEWIDNEINKLMCEFSSIDNAENTTKRREIILCMITKLKSMKPLTRK